MASSGSRSPCRTSVSVTVGRSKRFFNTWKKNGPGHEIGSGISISISNGCVMKRKVSRRMAGKPNRLGFRSRTDCNVAGHGFSWHYVRH